MLAVSQSIEDATDEVQKTLVNLGAFVAAEGKGLMRLERMRATQQNISLQNFTSADEFRSVINSQTGDQTKNIYLIDYELLGQGTNGLNVIEELKLSENVVLVTSRYDEPAIQQRCELLKIKLLPKSLAGFVPIELQLPEEKYDL